MTWLLLTSCKAHPAVRLLFIGNSYTFFNGGIDRQLEGLAPSSDISRIAVSGYTLEQHWEDGNALRTIRQGGWNYVILQEQSQTPVIDRDKFYQAAEEFDREIKHIGAKTVLLMTWQRPDSSGAGVTTGNLAAAYQGLASQIGARLAPAGLAFARSQRERPGLVLDTSDGHPTVYGTYLAACVLYRTIFASSPAGNPYSDSSISPQDRAFLQQIAAETSAY